ncbi:MAG TPA: alternative ribosome rescue aminoacyl-tRNA hydrolase ArfB [Parapedobacter sp.]|uniref:alternative ribosome rescue aminoacyl-tRNA hydrolase ArfB n=1 Tax=Parapedobacter sp. TaxID=1958893 RepID=UPI002BB83C8A|nr:alternative ribosome rescue aminoacyl-tRNA hydrolase ArfB [Parapedobacter sp.]HWK56014.1 alternative ribosome rescue aminoacyl-tRNA hydrolase ArfB [Parapedobacter sp.]
MARIEQINAELLLPFVRFQTSRSGGAGGQHVNKVETKVMLLFDIAAATVFSEEEKARLRKRLSNRLQAEGLLQVTNQETRSQLRNKELALQKLVELVSNALKTEKPRKATKPSKAAVQRRLDTKRQQALRKINRRKDWF